jgi:hypothetical protein
MNSAFHAELAAHGRTLVTHIEMQAANGTPLASGRLSVAWTSPGDGTDDDGQIRPDDDLVFDVAQGEVINRWRGFDAATGGTDYGGEDVTERTFNNPGTYTLRADQTSITVEAAS